MGPQTLPPPVPREPQPVCGFFIQMEDQWKILPINQSLGMGKEKSVNACAMFMSKQYVFSKYPYTSAVPDQFSVPMGPGHKNIKPGDLNRAAGGWREEA